MKEIKMNKIPEKIIWKDVLIVFQWWAHQKITRVWKVDNEKIIDGYGNIYNLDIEKIASIFVPRSKEYRIGKNFRNKIDDFSDLEELWK